MVQLDNVVELVRVSKFDTVVDPSRTVESITGVELGFVVKMESSVESVKYGELEIGVDGDVNNGLCEPKTLDDEVADSVLSESDKVRMSFVDVAAEVTIAMVRVLLVVEKSVTLLAGTVFKEAVQVDNDAGNNVVVRRLNGLRPPVPQVTASTPQDVAATKTAKTVFEEHIFT